MNPPCVFSLLSDLKGVMSSPLTSKLAPKTLCRASWTLVTSHRRAEVGKLCAGAANVDAARVADCASRAIENIAPGRWRDNNDGRSGAAPRFFFQAGVHMNGVSLACRRERGSE